MTDTNEAGLAGGEQTSIPAHTPGGDGPLTPREAARSYTDWRRKQAAAAQNPAPVESATPATTEPPKSAEASAEADAAPLQEAPGETESQAEPAELPPIEPPRSWTKDEKERFATLPRETQEYLATRETERDRDHRTRQNEAAEKLKGLTAKEQAAEQARQQYEQTVQLALNQLQSAYAGEFSDIKTMDDVQRLAVEDPLRYSKWDASQKRIAAFQQEANAAQQRAAQEASTKLEAFKASEAEKLAEKVPEIADKVQREKLFTAGRELMREVGFTDNEIKQLADGESAISLHDHRLHLLIRDGVLYRESQASRAAAAAKLNDQRKPVPPVQRPGTAPDKGAGQQQLIKNLSSQLEKASGMKAIHLAAQLQKAKRVAVR